MKLRLEDSEKACRISARRNRSSQTNDKASIAETNLATANAALEQC